MILRAATIEGVADVLRGASATGAKIMGVDLSQLNRVVELTPEDMTVTAEAGLTLAALQARLATHRQWLPIDPPGAGQLSIGAMLATNASGPRRCGFGTIRDWLIGIKVVLADGRAIKSGGRVVKNVAGYDMAKLFIGSRGSLGIIVEATFKVWPMPEAEQIVQTRCGSLKAAGDLIGTVVESDITPVVMDLCYISNPEKGPSPSLILGFSGTLEEVEWQVAEARRLGLNDAATLDHEKEFWKEDAKPHRTSVLPSGLIPEINRLGSVRFVARAANGVIYYWGDPTPQQTEGPHKLLQRLKEEFDPKHILSDPPLQ